MGIRVDNTKVVSINDAHEEGVDTSIQNNPTVARLQGLEVHHIFRRNGRGERRDDGNPLNYALKGQRGFSITAYWKGQLLNRARMIIGSMPDCLTEFDQCLELPSSSPFCRECAVLISETMNVPLMNEAPFRKKLIGEMLADVESAPMKVKPGKLGSYKSQLNTWQNANPDAICQAKTVDTAIRPLFRFLAPIDDVPNLAGQRILVVDDIMSSGSSLLSAREILVNQFDAEVTGITFLGRL